MSSMPEIFFSISYVLLVILVSVDPDCSIRLFIYRILSVCVFFVALFWFSGLEQYPLSVCLFVCVFFKGFIDFFQFLVYSFLDFFKFFF